MMYYTHLAFAFLAGLFTYTFSPPLAPIPYFALVLLGALLPDIDHRESIISKWMYPLAWLITFFFRHRGIIHSLFFITALFWTISSLFGVVYAIPLCLGFLSHVLIDSLTVHGINYLYPLTTLKISGFIETGKAGEFMLFLVLLALIAMKIFFW
ncbi:metal-dependent hydrolase [Candidatus Woesearchaeota archaeon]|nr:metal-dependent hydrolase [Candidatus Woesearchaeota archaeon]